MTPAEKMALRLETPHEAINVAELTAMIRRLAAALVDAKRTDWNDVGATLAFHNRHADALRDVKEAP